MPRALAWLGRLVRTATRPVREWRFRAKRWSSAADRAFHDALYAGPRYDPFSASYPGYVTIRRFADLAEAALTPDTERVVDLGCGPGEITCELARRRPGVRFVGLDHSEAAIARARKNAQRLELGNVEFARDDVTRASIETGDLIMMFDSFHHLPDPQAFVDRLRPEARAFFLIEPAGAWHGGHRRDLSFDWLLAELDNVRARVEYMTGSGALGPEVAGLGPRGSGLGPEVAGLGPRGSGLGPEASGPGPRPSGLGPGVEASALERRYTLEDFGRFFDGLAIDVRGTVAGFSEYPPDPYQVGPLRERFGRLAYDVIVAIDERLYEIDRDLLAPHWAILAAPGARPGVHRNVPLAGAPPATGRPAPGAYDIAYLDYGGPSSARRNAELVVRVRVKNRSWRVWRSDDEPPIFASYRWCDPDGAGLVEGGRTALVRPLAPDEEADVALRLRTPDSPGKYLLSIDFVHEGVTWFSGAGSPPLDVPFRVR